MDRAELSEKVIAIIKDNLGEKEVHEDNNLIDDLKVDSLDIIELVMALEENFGVQIIDNNSEKWLTVKNIIDFLWDEKFTNNG